MEKFKEIMEQTISAIKEFTEVEQTKLDAAAAADLVVIEACMKKEQALVMRIKGLEQERVRWQEEKGYAGLTFKKLLERVSPEERTELEPVYDQISERLKVFQDISKSAEQIIRTNLYVVEQKLERQGQAYHKDGSAGEAQEGHLTDCKV